MGVWKLLGGKEFNASGHLVFAKSAVQYWMVQSDPDQISTDDVKMMIPVDKKTKDWERLFLDNSASLKETALGKGIELSYASSLRYDDIWNTVSKLLSPPTKAPSAKTQFDSIGFFRMSSLALQLKYI